jgi:cytoskeletal protein CcmA (bactofilin family)
MNGTSSEHNGQSSVLAEGLILNGQLEGAGHITILGTVKGRIRLDGDCHVDHQGQIDGDVEAENIFLAGRIAGNMTATNRVEVLGTGHVEGDIRVPRIAISDGASINGHVHVGDV